TKSKGKTLTNRFDHLVQQANARLASAIPRRSFIGRLTSGIIMVGGTSLILKPSEARAGLCGISECQGTDAVGVCYSSWKVTAAGGIGVYKGPSFSVARVTDSSCIPFHFPVHAHLGRV